MKDRIDPANVSYLYGIEFAKFTNGLVDLTSANFIAVVANAGLDQTAHEGAPVMLDGSLSTGPSLSYAWSQLAGPVVALSGAATAHPTFTAPHVSVAGATLTFKLIVTGSDGRVSNPDTVDVHVLDTNDPPVCNFAQPSVASLWPPNHGMVPVSILGVSDPNNEQITFIYTAVTQDEPVNGLGDGDMSPDAAVSGQQILLRAERAGTGNGRVYEVRFMARDAQGASCSGTVKVSVPHSKKDQAVDSGQAFNSLLP